MNLTEAFEFVGRQRSAWMTPKGTWKEPFCYNRVHVLRHLGAKTNIKNIRKADLAKMRNALLDEPVNASGKKRSIGGVNRIMTLVNTLMTELEDQDILERAPHIKGMKENNERKAYFKKAQIEELIKRAREQGKDELADAVMFSAYSGCRQSELLNLVARDVDVNSGLMIFRDTKDGNDFETNISERLIPMLRNRLRTKGGTQRVFEFRNDDHLRDEFYRIRDEMGIDKEHVWHVIRHSTGTWLAEAGVSINQIAMVLNHKNVSTSERYVKRTNTQRKSAIDKLL